MDHVRIHGTVLERWLRTYVREYNDPRDASGYMDHVRYDGTVMGRGTRGYAFKYHGARANIGYMELGAYGGAIMDYLNRSGRPRKGAFRTAHCPFLQRGH